MTVFKGIDSTSDLDYPTVDPTLDLNFALTKTLDPRITFTRNSIGTYVGSDGLIKTAVANEPRFDHDYSTGKCLGFLIEDTRTNLIPQSQTFSSGWNIGNCSLFTNSSIAPDGTNTSTKLVEDTSTSSHGIDYPYGWGSATPLVLSVYAKPAERFILSMSGYNTAADLEHVFFNLKTGIISNPSKGSIQELPNGWYRCILITSGAGFGGPRIHLASTPVNPGYYGSPQSYTGDGNSGIYIWGLQYEVGNCVSSYIPTTTSTMTRSIDVATITGTNFSSWYNQSEGTIFQHYLTRAPFGGPSPDTSNAGASVILDGNIGQGDIGFYRGAVSTNLTARVYTGTTFSASFSFTFKIPQNKMTKSILAYKTNDFAATIDGDVVQTDNSGIVPPMNKMGIGAQINATYNRIGCGVFSRITYYPKRLPNSQLQLLTQN